MAPVGACRAMSALAWYDEIAAVVAHEAAHLLFGHAQKKATNATSGQLMARAIPR